LRNPVSPLDAYEVDIYPGGGRGTAAKA
jgi:hypothetical protein